MTPAEPCKFRALISSCRSHGDVVKAIFQHGLFNYTENTIDQCIALMLGPFKGALEAGKTPLEVDIFSADPRITDRFNEAWEKLKKETSKKRNAAPANSPQSQLPSYPVQEPAHAVVDGKTKSFFDPIYAPVAAAMDKFKLGITMPTYAIPVPSFSIPSFAIPTVTMPTFGTRKCRKQRMEKQQTLTRRICQALKWKGVSRNETDLIKASELMKRRWSLLN